MNDPTLASLEYGEGEINIKGLVCAMLFCIHYLNYLPPPPHRSLLSAPTPLPPQGLNFKEEINFKWMKCPAQGVRTDLIKTDVSCRRNGTAFLTCGSPRQWRKQPVSQ